MVQGRKNVIRFLGNHTFENQRFILIHCASLGEYEMAIPVIDYLKVQFPNHDVVVSFYSPSGYEHAALPSLSEMELTTPSSSIHPTGSVYKTFLPWDRKKDISLFLNRLKPEFTIIIRYEFWLTLINTLNQRQIPFAILGLNAHANNFLNQTWSGAWKQAISKVTALGVINENMIEQVQKWGVPKNKIFIWGDSKFNRAMDRFNAEINMPEPLHQWLVGKNTLILGSSWEAEESLLEKYLNQFPLPQNWQILIAPHNIETSHCQNLLKQFASFNPTLATQLGNNNTPSHVVILNTIGQLAQAYRFGKIAFIGGAFGKGLHNIAEAAVFGMPILFGPHHQKFPEAQQAINAGFAFQIQNQEDCNKILNQLIENHTHITQLGQIAHTFAANNLVHVETLSSIPQLVSLSANKP